jgi:U3 small nucleolar RNA-associated protein 25
MQNWEHLDFVMKHANKLPTAAHDTDFSRVRQYFLEGNAAQHRQLLVTSHFNEPELQAFFREHAQSVAGSVRFKKNWGKGQLANVISGAKQVFQLVPGVRDFESQENARFKYFKESVLAPVLRLGQKHTLIVTPSYLHYIRVRNELMSQEVRCSAMEKSVFTPDITLRCLCVPGERGVRVRVQSRQRDLARPVALLPRHQGRAALLWPRALLPVRTILACGYHPV